MEAFLKWRVFKTVSQRKVDRQVIDNCPRRAYRPIRPSRTKETCHMIGVKLIKGWEKASHKDLLNTFENCIPNLVVVKATRGQGAGAKGCGGSEKEEATRGGMSCIGTQVVGGGIAFKIEVITSRGLL